MKKVLVVGYGNRGKTLGSHIRNQLYDTLDPNGSSDFRNLDEIDPSNYSEIIIATSEKEKSSYIEFAINNSLHVLVEKPLLYSEEVLLRWQESANRQELLIRTAYAHKYENHILQAKEFLNAGKLGVIYTVRAFYGNGTAENIRNSEWRDSPNAVVVDLLPHLLDLTRFFIGPIYMNKINLAKNNFENLGTDFAILFGTFGEIQCNLTASYISWQNNFEFEIVGSRGMLRISGLEKWQDVNLELYERKSPPAPPRKIDISTAVNEGSLSRQWETFKNDTDRKYTTDLSGDIEISRILTVLTNAGILS